MSVTDADMDALQGEGGLISDNCVHWEDVAEADRLEALAWLERWRDKHNTPSN